MKPRLQQRVNGRGRTRYVPFLLSAVAVLVYQFPSLGLWMQYDRGALGNAQVWRWVTGHWTHYSLDHLVLDVLTFLVLATLCNRLDRRAFRWAMILSLLFIPTTLWVLEPSLITYRGLSGIDSALFVLATLLLRHQAKRHDEHRVANLQILALFLFGAKVAIEARTGQALFVQSTTGIRIVPIAHLAGALAGFVAYFSEGLGTLFSLQHPFGNTVSNNKLKSQ